ncbi:MAG TPA: choice-of-anchor Q domain-containing protein, partial [Chitinophagales bacterium]|nr:choice-of-anchor Q domain-containing protein [Chitinophagales bacterium]
MRHLAAILHCHRQAAARAGNRKYRALDIGNNAQPHDTKLNFNPLLYRPPCPAYTVGKTNIIFYTGGAAVIASLQNLILVMKTASTFLAIFWLVSAVLCFNNANAATRYVKPTATGTGTGNSWVNASGDLQAMINASAVGDEVWVAAGTYKPTAEPDGTTDTPRDFTFYMKDGVAIYGGFAGTETMRSQRNWTTNVTTLSGDIGTVDNASDNCMHVVVSVSDASSTILDGFTVSGGNADGSGSRSMESSSISRFQGGGIYTHNSMMTVANCLISGNNATLQGGGGLINGGNSTYTDCIFSGNSTNNNGSIGGGGGISFTNSASQLVRCSIIGNSSAYHGGGVRVAIEPNTPTLTNCRITGNSTLYSGGGIYAFRPLTLINCTISGNNAGNTNGGGGIASDNANPVLTNCIIWNNRAATSTGSATANVINYGTSAPVITNCLIEAIAGNANYPNFVSPLDPATAPSTAGNFQFAGNCSPAIDTGTNTGAPTTDLFGNTRPFGTNVDIGVHEFQGASAGCSAPAGTIWYVDAANTGCQLGTSWACAFQNLQDAINIASIGHEIWVKAGTYKPTEYPANCTGCSTARDYAFSIKSGVSVYGGFAGTESTLAQRNIAANPTILSGDLNGNDVFDINNGGYQNGTGNDNCHHIVIMFATSSHTYGLDGFVITGGNANGSGSISIGGVTVFRTETCGVYVRNLNDGSNLTIANNIIFNNSASITCGISAVNYGTQTINNNTIYNNISSGSVAGMRAFNAEIQMITNNTIFNNRAGSKAGVDLVSSADANGIQTISNNVIYGNVSTGNAGGIYLDNSVATQILINNTIYNNTAGSNGGGLSSVNSSGTQYCQNNIFWGNKKGSNTNVVGADIHVIAGVLTVSHCLTQQNSAFSSGMGIINNQDPLFINAANPAGGDGIHRTADDGFRLQPGSPASNAGTGTNAPATDITGSTRIALPDIGAYEGVVCLEPDNTVSTFCFSGLNTAYCSTDAPVTLTGSQAPNGTFSGPGITDNGNGTATFNPAAAGTGGTVTYTPTGETFTNMKASDGSHSLAIKPDGTLWVWGWNIFGELGIGNSSQQNSPIQVGNGTNWASITAGSVHTLAIKTDGTLWAWGYNLYGQLGIGNNTDQNSPVQVGTATNWASVSSSYHATLAIKTDGTLWAWGSNEDGQLGLGNNTDQNSPVQVGTATNWASVSVGTTHVLALKTDGTLWAWGNNFSGQLGIGNTTNQLNPIQVGTATNWASISAGGEHSLAKKTDGTIWAWGRNNNGQLGIGNLIQQTNPVKVGTATNWASVSAGGNHNLALKTDGTLWAWGRNIYGQLGIGNTTQQTSPVQVGTATNWASVSAGSRHSMARKINNSLWAWGAGGEGQLGINNTNDQTSPIQVGAPIISASKTVTVTSFTTAGITNNTGTTVLTCTTTSISVTATGGTSYAW